MMLSLLANAFLLAQPPAKTAESSPRQSGCAVSHTLAELKQVFAQGRVPSALELTGSWMTIGDFSLPSGPGFKEYDRVDCAGLKYGDDRFQLRTQTLQEVLLVEGYSVEPRIVGNEWNTGNRQTFKRDGRRSVTFDLGLGGDASAYYRCRLTQRGTLACLVEPYYSGVEFMKMRISADRLCRVKTLLNGWRVCDIANDK